MKLVIKLLLVLALVASVSFGCGEKKMTPGKFDVAALEKTFGPAEPASKELMLKAVAEIKASDYAGALADLGKLNKNENLSPEQRQAVNTVMQQIVPLLPPKSPLAPMAPSRQ